MSTSQLTSTRWNLSTARAFHIFVFSLMLGTGFSDTENCVAQPLETPSVSRKLDSPWIDPNGNPLPFETGEELEDFLKTAKIISVAKIPEGVTRPVRLLLEKDGVQAHAIFRFVDTFKPKERTKQGLRFNFRDSCLFECAAYELDKLLGLNHVPPVVRREFGVEDFSDSNDFHRLKARKGTVQAWVENAFTETNRRRKKISPPSYRRWGEQWATLRFFDNLIFNDDRNLGNILIGPDWKIWFIDATRAFRPISHLSTPETVQNCSHALWERFRGLEADVIRTQLEPFLSKIEMDALLNRKSLLTEHVEKLIIEQGEDIVLF